MLWAKTDFTGEMSQGSIIIHPRRRKKIKAQFRKKTSRNLWKTIYQEKQQFSSAPYWNPIACFERFTKENEKENKKDERENFVHIDVGGADVGPDWCKAKANVGRW